MIITVFDTETTGLPRKQGSPIEDQPYVIQLAAVQFNLLRPISHLSAILGYDVEVPERAAQVHGITTEILQHIGTPPELVWDRFTQMVLESDVLVAHNSGFDVRLIEIACERDGMGDLDTYMKGTETVCTMISSVPAVKKPGRYGNYGWPKLTEAHEHFTGRGFEGAHDAMADAMACSRVYFGLLEQGYDLVGGVKK